MAASSPLVIEYTNEGTVLVGIPFNPMLSIDCSGLPQANDRQFVAAQVMHAAIRLMMTGQLSEGSRVIREQRIWRHIIALINEGKVVVPDGVNNSAVRDYLLNMAQ